MGLDKFPKRGEIFLVSLDPSIGSEIKKIRPALVISNDINNKLSPSVTVIPVTSKVERVFPFEVLFAPTQAGLTQASKAKCNQIRTIDKRRLIKAMGNISFHAMREVEDSLRIHLGMYFENGSNI